jgi:hypothetical protein
MTNDTLLNRRRLLALMGTGQAHERPVATYQQLSIWRTALADPADPENVVCYRIALPCSIPTTYVAAALDHLAKRHPELNARIGLDETGVVKTYAPPSFPLLETRSGLGDLREVEQRFLRRPIDVAGGPLAEAMLLQLEGGRRLLLVRFHHLVIDARSAEILVADFVAALSDAQTGHLSDPVPDRSYESYARAQRAAVATLEGKAQFAARLRRLAKTIDAHPYIKAGGARFSFQQRHVTAMECEALADYAARQRTTPAMLLAGSFAHSVADLLACRSFAVSIFTAHRNRVDLMETVGLFAEPVLCPITLDGADTATTARRIAEELAQEAVPLELLLARLRRDFGIARPRCALAYFNHVERIRPTVPADLQIETVEPEGAAQAPASGYSLALTVNALANGWELNLVYRSDLIEMTAAARVLGNLSQRAAQFAPR